MSLSKNAMHSNDRNMGTAGKATTLNPHAAEFIPFSLRSPSSVSTSNHDPATRFTSLGSLGKAVVNRTESSISNNSDDESHQFWHHQLPDDITPDFKVFGEDNSQSLPGLSLSGLSLHDDNEAARFSASAASGYVLNELQEISPRGVSGNNFTENVRFSGSAFGEDTSSASYMQMLSKPWDKQIGNSDQLFGGATELSPYNGSSRLGSINEVLGEHGMVDGNETNPMEFLASIFPGFATDSLAEVYCANRCDMNMTIEMLTELELQIDGAFNPILNSKTVSAPNLTAVDFPALSAQESQNGLQKYAGDDLPQNGSSYRPNNDKDQLLMFKSSSAAPSRGAIDFASAVKKLPARDSGIWKYDRNGSPNPTIGSSRSSQVLASAYNSGNGRSIYSDRSQNRVPSRAAPVWVETGEAVANLYSELREEARDHARVRNAYFEQARQAYLVGNKALAKELSVKGQYHSMHMKASHGKAQESIFRQRNPVSAEMQGPDRMIDLHGLHVTEAIHILKHELAVLRTTARSTNQRLRVYICVGTGHHTRGSRTPARLPVSIQRYLLEEEGLEFTEPQPGLLHVVIY